MSHLKAYTYTCSKGSNHTPEPSQNETFQHYHQHYKQCSCSLQAVGHCLIYLTNDLIFLRSSGQFFYFNVWEIVVIVKVVKLGKCVLSILVVNKNTATSVAETFKAMAHVPCLNAAVHFLHSCLYSRLIMIQINKVAN